MAVLTAYKVVTKLATGGYTGLWSNNKYRVKYQIGVKTVPEFGYLFAFETKNHALMYATQFQCVLESLVDVVDPSIKVERRRLTETGFPDSEPLIDLREFWDRKLYHLPMTDDVMKSIPSINLAYIPYKTIFCNWIQPERVVNPAELSGYGRE